MTVKDNKRPGKCYNSFHGEYSKNKRTPISAFGRKKFPGAAGGPYMSNNMSYSHSRKNWAAASVISALMDSTRKIRGHLFRR